MTKMASSYGGTCARDLLQGLVTEISPLMCTDPYLAVSLYNFK